MAPHHHKNMYCPSASVLEMAIVLYCMISILRLSSLFHGTGWGCLHVIEKHHLCSADTFHSGQIYFAANQFLCNSAA